MASRSRALRADAFVRPRAAPRARAIAPSPSRANAPGRSLQDRAEAGAGDRLDLGSRIALAGDLQHTVGNAATAQLVGLARTDRKKEPPNGAKELMDASGPGNRGLTRTSYAQNPPIFRAGAVFEVNGGWGTKPAPVKLPSLDHEVFYPAPGRHRLGAYGKGSHYLDVTEDWSARILQGEEEHVGDIDRAWEVTWGAVAQVINTMSEGQPITGSTPDDARKAAWEEFKRRLPTLLRPAGETATTEAQEAKWGTEDKNTVFKKLMNESKRARDNGGWHTPDEASKASEGDDRVDELAVGSSKIGQVKPVDLIKQAWDGLAKG